MRPGYLDLFGWSALGRPNLGFDWRVDGGGAGCPCDHGNRVRSGGLVAQPAAGQEQIERLTDGVAPVHAGRPAVFDVQAVRHHLQVRLPGKIDQCQNQLLWLNGEHDLLIQIDRSGGRWRD